MAALVQSAKGGHCPPGTIAAKAAGPEVTNHRGEFSEWQSGTMKFQRIEPRRWQLLKNLEPPHGITHRRDRRLLLILGLHIFTVRSPIRFVPILPCGIWELEMATDELREDVLF